MAGRKRGGKNADTDLKAEQALNEVINGNKTRKQVAEELGVHPQTVSERIQKALTPERIQQIVGTSRSRLIEMLSRCDDAYHRVLTWNAPDNFGNQIRVATSIYKTFGLINDEAQIKVTNIIPIQVVIEDPKGERVYRVGPAETASKTGSSIREPE